MRTDDHVNSNTSKSTKPYGRGEVDWLCPPRTAAFGRVEQRLCALSGKHCEALPRVRSEEVNAKGAYADARSCIHLGACSATTEKDADYLLRNNYQYTRVLCNWALSNEVRFVYASSAATYGAGELGYNDEDEVTPLSRRRRSKSRRPRSQSTGISLTIS